MVLLKIYEKVKGEAAVWRRRTNTEIIEKYGQLCIINITMAQRIRWLGHIQDGR